jgi:DNA-binding transcriptional MocR family regulator
LPFHFAVSLCRFTLPFHFAVSLCRFTLPFHFAVSLCLILCGSQPLSLELSLDRTRTLALYQQIVEQLKARMSDGRLPAGARLPTVRRLAADLGVTRLTVQNAYSELQSAGWVESTVGRGTYVSPKVNAHSFGQGMVAPLTPDGVISDILQVNQIVGLRSMASASPDPRLFPAEEFWATLAELQTDAAAMVTYSSSQGDPQLRIEISRDLLDRGIDLAPDQLLVTAGVTGALALISRTLAQPGDRILVEQPTYLGLLHTLKLHGIEAVSVPLDAEGPILAEVEKAIVQHRPRFFYTVPTFQNPTGHNMSLARREALLALAADYGLILVEDDIYGRLAFDAPALPTLYALDRHNLVFYVSSYSKVLMPGLRLGFVAAPSRWADRLLSLRRATDLCSPTLLQRALALFLRNGGLKRHLRKSLPIYRERRNAMVTALQRTLPPDIHWEIPTGGFCVWLTMPSYHPFADLEQAVLRQGWAVTPGEVFLAEPSAQKSLRLCYGTLTPDAIHAGVNVVSRLVRERLHAQSRPALARDNWTPLV